ncbi:MAG: hypothetical protein R3E12_06450 [Candidatus Eisenbacteria bacterium]
MSPAPGMAMRITFATVFLLLASLCATTVQAVPISVPSVVISDRESDPLTRGTSPGALLMMRYRNATTFITSSALGFVDPEGFAIRPDRWIYVADSGADPLRLGEPRGAVWLVDPSERFDSSVARLIAASQLFVDPTDLLLESDGNLLLADPNADPYDRGARSGAIFRIDPATGNVSVVSASTLFSDPRSLARDTDGTVLVLDRTADPLGTGIRGGALFRLHPTSGAVVTVRAFDATQTRRLMAVAVLPDGDYAICDADADPGGSGTPRGAIFRLRKSTGRLETLIDSPFFSDPIDIAMGLGNELWALDQNSDFDNSPSTRGGVFGFDVTQGVALHAQSHPFLREPAALSFVDGPAIDSTKVTWTDVTGGGSNRETSSRSGRRSRVGAPGTRAA